MKFQDPVYLTYIKYNFKINNFTRVKNGFLIKILYPFYC